MEENGIVPVQEDLVKIGERILRRNQSCCLAVLMLDDSASMAQHGTEPLEALDHQIAALKQAQGAENTILMVYEFSEEARLVVPPVALHDAQPLGLYVPNGQCTRLVASVGQALHAALMFQSCAKQLYGSEVFVAVSVISDGADNASTEEEYVREAVLAKDARQRGFDLQVIGIGIEGPELAALLQFDGQHAVTVAPTRAGVRRATDMSVDFVTRTMSHTQVGTFVPNPGVGGSGEIDEDDLPTNRR